jgi:hypothetical protein
MVSVARKRATYAEYMAFTETSELKHEYIAGEIVAMAGGTIAHGRLIGQVTGLIRDALKGRPFVVLPAEVGSASAPPTARRTPTSTSSGPPWRQIPTMPTRSSIRP